MCTFLVFTYDKHQQPFPFRWDHRTNCEYQESNRHRWKSNKNNGKHVECSGECLVCYYEFWEQCLYIYVSKHGIIPNVYSQSKCSNITYLKYFISNHQCILLKQMFLLVTISSYVFVFCIKLFVFSVVSSCLSRIFFDIWLVLYHRAF